MSALPSSTSSSIASRRSLAPALLPTPAAHHALARPMRGAVQVVHSTPKQQPLMQTLAGFSAGVMMFQAAPALLAPEPAAAFASSTTSLTEVQLLEAEKLYDAMRERTGRDLPKLSSSPNEAQALRFSQAGPDATISQLKDQLQRMNSLLAAEKQLVEADRSELFTLQQAINKMRAAEAMAPALAAAPPVQVPAPPAAESGNANLLGGAAIGGLGLFAFAQNTKAKSAKEELDRQLAAERQRVAALEAQAAKMRAELAQEQELVAQLRQQMELSEQRSRLTITSEKRRRDLAARDNDQAKKSLEEERKRILAAKFDVIAAREKAQAALAAKEQEMLIKMEAAIEKEQQRSRLMVASAKRESMLEAKAGNAAKEALEAERKRVLATKNEVFAVREKAQAALVAKEQEMAAKMEQAVEKERQMGRLWLTSAKRESMMAVRANEELKKQAETDRKRMLATKMEIIDVRERAHASVLAKEAEMTVKMEAAIAKEQQMGRLYLTSAKRESKMATRINDEVKAMAENDRKRMLATKMEIIAVREKAHAALVAKEQEMNVKLEQAVEKEKQTGRLWLTSAKREGLMAVRANEDLKKQAETDRKRMLATKMEIIDVREKAHAALLAKEQQMLLKLEQAVEKEKQMGRLWLTSAKRESLMALRTNDDLKKQAETDRKRMLATKMEIIDVRERAHAALLAKEAEMNVKMEQAVEKEKQTGRLWLTSAKRESMMALRANDDLKKQAETDRKRMLATKMEIIDVREKAHAALVAKEQEMVAKMDEAIEKEKQSGRLWLTSARRESMIATRSNADIQKQAETDRKRMLATKMEIIAVREKAHAALVAKEQEMAAKMEQAVDKERQLGRLWLTSSKRENMLAARALAEAKQALDADRKRMVAAKREAIAAREEAAADRVRTEAAHAKRLAEAIEREQQRARLLQASARRENMLLQRDADAVTAAAEADRKKLIAAKSDVLATMSKAQADRLAVEAELMAKMKTEVERVQQFGRLSVASERRQVVEARRAVAEASKALEAERKLRIAAKSESLAYKEQVAAERSEREAAVAEVERLQQLVQNGGNGAVIAPKAVTAQDNKPNATAAPINASLHKQVAKMVGTDTSSMRAPQPATAAQVSIALAEKEVLRVEAELESAAKKVQTAAARVGAAQQQVQQRQQAPQQLQEQIAAAVAKEQQLAAQVESLKTLVSDAAADSDEEEVSSAQATVEFAQRKAANAAASTSALRAQLADASKTLAAATYELSGAEAARAAAASAVQQLTRSAEQARQRVAELKAATQSAEVKSGYRSDEEEAMREVAELEEAAKQVSLNQ